MSKRKLVDVRKFNVLGDNILIKAIGIVERDGIIKPASYEDKPELGEVMGMGVSAPPEIKKGMTVYFNKYSTTKFNFDGSDFYFVRAEDVVAYQ